MMSTESVQNISIPLSGIYAGHETSGRQYGSGSKVAILSNMNPNNQSEWAPLVMPLTSHGYMVLTYDYIGPQNDQSTVLTDVLSYAKRSGAESVALIGASRGGVTSMQVAARSGADDVLVGVVAISAPVEHAGAVFFNRDELERIRVPKLLINTEHDECAAGTKQMFDMVPVPKEMDFYSGDAHGTAIFSTSEGARVIRRLNDFTSTVLG